MELVYLTFILVLSIFLGFELISKVPATLHTPLMSGTNAISGIVVVGAIISSGGSEHTTSSRSAATCVRSCMCASELHTANASASARLPCSQARILLVLSPCARSSTRQLLSAMRTWSTMPPIPCTRRRARQC